MGTRRRWPHPEDPANGRCCFCGHEAIDLSLSVASSKVWRPVREEVIPGAKWGAHKYFTSGSTPLPSKVAILDSRCEPHWHTPPDAAVTLQQWTQLYCCNPCDLRLVRLRDKESAAALLASQSQEGGGSQPAAFNTAGSQSFHALAASPLVESMASQGLGSQGSVGPSSQAFTRRQRALCLAQVAAAGGHIHELQAAAEQLRSAIVQQHDEGAAAIAAVAASAEKTAAEVLQLTTAITNTFSTILPKSDPDKMTAAQQLLAIRRRFRTEAAATVQQQHSSSTAEMCVLQSQCEKRFGPGWVARVLSVLEDAATEGLLLDEQEEGSQAETSALQAELEAAHAQPSAAAREQLLAPLRTKVKQLGKQLVAEAEKRDEMRVALFHAGLDVVEGVLCGIDLEDVEQLVRAAVSGDVIDLGEEWLPPGHSGRRAPDAGAITAILDSWRPGPHGRLDGSKMSQLSDIVAKYQLRIGSLQELMYALLSLCTGQPVADLSAVLKLPSYGSIWTAFHATSIGRRDELQALLQGKLFGVECDEGSFQRCKAFMILVTMLDSQRFYLDTPKVTSLLCMLFLLDSVNSCFTTCSSY